MLTWTRCIAAPTPVYTITLTSSGIATLDGEKVSEPGLTPARARVAALAEVRINAAYPARPVRVLAKEWDGSPWPLIVAVDGAVTTLDLDSMAALLGVPGGAAAASDCILWPTVFSALRRTILRPAR
ncbi:hypothetical protein OG429_02255 [Streptomyces sp. NBC_00190]|uniref:hypothetical protein n=1 Tax=unclassified Streptomyces TaxID=2593676 RepID=UPI002E2C464A|nr:hypothetical protein [Streptomyces sp. NBC_00190]WSZ38242.1 hypothetical protein OG239_05255 [Streptomyces sp. NBC_00868]